PPLPRPKASPHKRSGGILARVKQIAACRMHALLFGAPPNCRPRAAPLGPPGSVLAKAIPESLPSPAPKPPPPKKEGGHPSPRKTDRKSGVEGNSLGHPPRDPLVRPPPGRHSARQRAHAPHRPPPQPAH